MALRQRMKPDLQHDLERWEAAQQNAVARVIELRHSAIYTCL